jgi:hypothetical protein
MVVETLPNPLGEWNSWIFLLQILDNVPLLFLTFKEMQVQTPWKEFFSPNQ